jgi:hypothetical protein
MILRGEAPGAPSSLVEHGANASVRLGRRETGSHSIIATGRS